MKIMEIVLCIISLIASIVAIVISLKKSSVKEIVKTEQIVKVEYAPVEHPFIYDDRTNSYTLEGNLLVTGGVSCLEK